MSEQITDQGTRGVDHERAGDARPSLRQRLKEGLGEIGSVAKETVVEWLEDGIPARGAALSYYVLLSLGPLLVLLIAVMEFFFTSQQARARVVRVLRDNFGPRLANTTATVLERVTVPDILAPESLLTIGLLLFGATAAFANVRGSLNKIWGVEPSDQSTAQMALDLVRARVRGFVMIIFTGLVVALSFVVTSMAEVLLDAAGALSEHGTVVRIADGTVSLLLTGLLFAAIYRTLPAARIEWSSVWVGAFATALIFVLGKTLVAFLLTTVSWTSYYGPGASVVAFLAWIYFSSQLFFLGAEFTQVWSRRRGGVIAAAREEPV